MTQIKTSISLRSAAVCSDSIWQPTVNALQAVRWSFNATIAASGATVIFALFVGLRMRRMVHGNIFQGVETTNHANLKADAAMSLTVGGAA